MTQVVPIDPQVRVVLNEFVNLYATFEQAASAIGVNRSTIAVYVQGARTLPVDRFREIARIVQRRVPVERLAQILPRNWEQRILDRVQEHTFLHQDSTAYRLNEDVIRFLEFYVSHFPNRTRAAEALGIKPRTFKAYLNASINSFPRTAFQKALSLLEEQGETESAICDALAYTSLDSILKPADRTARSEMSATEIIDALVDLWLEGGGSVREKLRPLYNWCQRNHGGLVPAYVVLMPGYLAEYEERGQAAISDGRADEVLGLLDRMLVAIRWYAGQISDPRRRAGLPQRFSWRDTIRKLVAVHNRLRDLLFKEAPFSHQYMAKTEIDKLLFRFRHLRGIRQYTPSLIYRPGDLLFHPLFGIGRVARQVSNHKVAVRFTDRSEEITLSIGT